MNINRLTNSIILCVLIIFIFILLNESFIPNINNQHQHSELKEMFNNLYDFTITDFENVSQTIYISCETNTVIITNNNYITTIYFSDFKNVEIRNLLQHECYLKRIQENQKD